MKITTVDGARQKVSANVDPNRYAIWDAYLRSQPAILGHGAGNDWNRPSARDAVEAHNFAISQLAYHEQKVYERQYQPRLFEKLLGKVIDRSAGPAAETVIYDVVDYVAMGRRISPAGNDMPFADAAYAQVAMQIAHGGEGYYYNTQDVRRAAFTGRSLPQLKGKAAVEGYLNHINVVALVGETASNFTGLFNNGSVTAANRPSAAVWDAATADTIVADFMSGMTAVHVATKTNSMPTNVAVPVTSYQLLLKPRSTNSDMTILAFLKATYPGLEITPAMELETLGAGVTKRVVYFTPDDENMVLHIPMGITFGAPQPKMLRIEVPGEYRYGGLNIRRVLTARYMDGV